MKKFYFLIILSLFSLQEVLATHTKGGWMYYEYLGPGINNPAKLRYRIGLNYYIDCNSNIIENPITFTIFKGVAPYNFLQDVSVPIKTNVNIQNCNLQACYPCISFIPTICYKVINYEVIVELDVDIAGYIISKQRCCRINNISNLQAPSNSLGATYSIRIPGANVGVPNSHINNSPKFTFNDTTIVCGNNLFSIDFSATDADGDSLVYTFCKSYDGGSQTDPNPATAAPPPYDAVPYATPYTGGQPLGALASINRVTGVVSGTAPPSGEYVITICVAEYRNGIVFAETRKELHLKIADCTPVAATMDPTFVTCGDLTLSFSNQSDNSSIQNWYWEFGDPSTGVNNSSTAQFPNHTFSTAGVYTVKLVVNRGLPCVDSTTQVVSVFPGFFPGFAPLAPYCVGKPITFNDTTRTNYGTVSNWSWNFGNTATLADTSHLQNPTYTYTLPGTYTIKLVTSNSKGCIDSTLRTITVLPTPALNVLPRDTTYCGRDTIQLRAFGTGTFSWTPNTFITGSNNATASVFPSTNTKYYVTINAAGCTNRDSVMVRPVFDLTASVAANPASMCEGDTITLTGTSNRTNVLFQWSPSASVASPTSAVTRAFPTISTGYTLHTRWGRNCIATAGRDIPVTPLAIPAAGPDTAYCTGQPGVQLNASGGATYIWTPATGLSNPNIANPIATPNTTTTYFVSVGVAGCSRRRPDTIKVTVRQSPILQMPSDTLICVIDTLRLISTGSGNFNWTPAYNINNTSIANPLVSPDVPTWYHVRLTDIFNCFTRDSVFIDVKPDVTVDAGNDTSICKTEGYRLTTTGDAVTYIWSPATGLSNPNIKNPVATPAISTLYTVTANIGKCQKTSDVRIVVADIPNPDAGLNAVVCAGFNTQLTASGGSIYEWTPSTYLNNAFIANPTVLQPVSDIKYVVTVRDTLGCEKAVKDSVYVQVIPRLNINAGPRDTSVVEGQSLVLNATGAITYLWTPDTWLNNPHIDNPVSTPDRNILYVVTGMDASGCLGSDSIQVNVYTLEPDMYVPTAFTPNGDGNNDVVRPILIGMKSLKYFKVFNRFGQLVFSTSEIGKGWNGIYAGKAQDMATFVWMAEGVTYKGITKTQKGYVVLIR